MRERRTKDQNKSAMNATPPAPLLLGFKVLTSGVEVKCSVLALGAVVMRNGHVLAQKRWTAYTDDVYFEPRYYRQFWGDKLYLLNTFEVPGTKHAALQKLITGFQQFRADWEQEALEQGVPLWLLADTFEVGSVNALIRCYTSHRPLPYGTVATTSDYYRLYDVDSVCRGWLAHADPSFALSWGSVSRAAQLLKHTKDWPSEELLPEAEAQRWVDVVSTIMLYPARAVVPASAAVDDSSSLTS